LTYSVGGRGRFLLILILILTLSTSSFVPSTSTGGIVGTRPVANYASYGELADNYTLVAEKDSFIISDSGNTNNGANSLLKVQQQRQMRTLVSFDLTPFENQELSSAKLRLYAQSNGYNWNNGESIEVHRLNTGWTEGNGVDNVKGTGQGVTWRCATDSNITNSVPDCNSQWSGSSFIAEPSDTIQITNNTKGVWLEFDVTDDVNYFLDSNTTNNFGWTIKKTNEQTSGGIAFSSKESNSYQPQLVLRFVDPTKYDSSIGTLTFAFGHAYKSELAAIKNVTSYNFVGNISPVVTKIGNSGYMTQSDLVNYKNVGWEILSHSMTHPRIDSTTSSSVLQYEIVQSKTALTNMGFCITGYESPFDVITTNSAVYIKNNYKYAVINPNKQNTVYSITHDGAQWNFPIAIHYSGVGKGLAIHDFATAKDAIDYAIDNHTYLILNFHQIDSSTNSYSTYPSVFWQILQYVKQKSDAGKLAVESSVQALHIACP